MNCSCILEAYRLYSEDWLLFLYHITTLFNNNVNEFLSVASYYVVVMTTNGLLLYSVRELYIDNILSLPY